MVTGNGSKAGPVEAVRWSGGSPACAQRAMPTYLPRALRRPANLARRLVAGIGLVQTLTSSNLLALERIQLLHEGGVYRVPALINDQLVKLFVVDSGSADVQVPAEV